MGKAWRALDTVAGWAEDHEERRRENNRAVLRALHTPAGMAVLGAVLLLVAGMLLVNSRVEARQQELMGSNGSIVTVDGIDGGGIIITADGDGVETEVTLEGEEEYTPPEWLLEIEREEEEQARRREAFFTVVSVLCGAVSVAYAVFLWTKRKNAAGKSIDTGTIPAESASNEEKMRDERPTAVENAESDSREARRGNLERLYKAGVLSKEEYRQRLEKL